MAVTLSSKGQIVAPSATRKQLGPKKGARLNLRVHGGDLILSPQRTVPAKARLGRNKLTGLPVVISPRGAPRITSAQVKELLAEIP